MTLDEIIYNALISDQNFNAAVGGRIRSTCFEVSPDEKDKIPLPSVIVTDLGLQTQPECKDTDWEGSEEHVQAGVEISAESPRAVRELTLMARKAVANYIFDMEWADRPMLDSVQTEGVAWDWLKPCYFDVLKYQCTIVNPLV